MRRMMLVAWFAALAAPAHADPVSITAFATGIASWWASIGIVGQALIGIGIALAATGIQYLLNGAGQTAQSASEDSLPTVNIPERDGLLERVRLYGTDTTAGGVFFQKTVGDASSNPSIYVFGATISEGVCDSLESVIINGVECLFDASGLPLTEPWNDGSNTYCKVSFRDGDPNQAIDPIIADRFPTEDTEFRQRGVCTVVMEMAFGSDADHHTTLWGAGGIPQLLFRVKGLHIYDPRDAHQDAADASTWTWSDNATLVQADWMTCAMGFGISPSEMNWPAIRASADTDDIYMPTLAGIERQGRCSGRAFASRTNADVLDSMAQMNRAIINKEDGVFAIRSRLVSEDPVATIHQDLLVGDIAYQNEPDTRAAINTVAIEFNPASRFNQSAETRYSDTDLIGTDGQEYELRVSLPFADTPGPVQRLGYAMVKENRVGRSLSMLLDIAAIYAPGKVSKHLAIGDVVTVYLRNYTAINGLYVVNSIEITTEFTVQIAMDGYDPDMISGWSVALEAPFEETV